MKRVFVGPSLAKALRRPFEARIEFRDPAEQGDIAVAVLEGVTVIGLIDGLFEDRAAVWHKELLFALSEGVHMFGGASLGALRAAECGPFGMIGVGAIYRSYAEGHLIDDDAVAQIHAPPQLDFAGLSEPLVNILATCTAALADGMISHDEATAISDAARKTFFKERSYGQAVAATASLSPERKAAILPLLNRCHRDLKGEDALELVRQVDAAPKARAAARSSWEFAGTTIWRRILQAKAASLPLGQAAASCREDLD